MGLGVGFVQDALTVGVFGYHMLSRSALGFLVGLMKEKVVRDNATFHMAVIALCSLALRFVFCLGFLWVWVRAFVFVLSFLWVWVSFLCLPCFFVGLGEAFRVCLGFLWVWLGLFCLVFL